MKEIKKFFKKTKAETRQKHPGRSKNTDQDQFTGFFKCGKMDHIIKNCPQLKEEQESESPNSIPFESLLGCYYGHMRYCVEGEATQKCV